MQVMSQGFAHHDDSEQEVLSRGKQERKEFKRTSRQQEMLIKLTTVKPMQCHTAANAAKCLHWASSVYSKVLGN
jgi:hypothetical protein